VWTQPCNPGGNEQEPAFFSKASVTTTSQMKSSNDQIALRDDLLNGLERVLSRMQDQLSLVARQLQQAREALQERRR
jgi:hypothetical protein